MALVSECPGSSIKIDKKRHLVLLYRIWVQVSSCRASSLMECITRFFYSFSLCVVFVCLILGLDLEPHTCEAIFVGDGVPQTWVIVSAVVFTESGPRSWKRNKSIEATEMRMWKLKWLLVLFVCFCPAFLLRVYGTVSWLHSFGCFSYSSLEIVQWVCPGGRVVCSLTCNPLLLASGAPN